MLKLELGNKFGAKNGITPWVRAELEPAPWFGKWWFEVDAYEEHDNPTKPGEKYWGWGHYYIYDGCYYGLARTIRKAEDALSLLYEKLDDEMFEKRKAERLKK